MWFGWIDGGWGVGVLGGACLYGMVFGGGSSGLVGLMGVGERGGGGGGGAERGGGSGSGSGGWW